MTDIFGLVRSSLLDVLNESCGDAGGLVADVLIDLVGATLAGTDRIDSELLWAKVARTVRVLHLYCEQREEASR
jgi:hypothetical protein